MSPWWPLLGLLSWCCILKSSHCNLFKDQAPIESIYGAWSSNEWQRRHPCDTLWDLQIICRSIRQMQTHDDVIKWKHFPRYWPFVRGIPSQRPVTRSFDVIYDLCLNKRFSKQPRRWWFEMPWCSLWRHCNEINGTDTGRPYYMVGTRIIAPVMAARQHCLPWKHTMERKRNFTS